MALAWTGSGGFFTRLGRIAKLLKDIYAFQNTTFPPDSKNIVAQYAVGVGAVDHPEIASPIASGAAGAQLAVGGFATTLQTAAQQTANAMVFDDNPLGNATNIATSMAEIIRQMNAAAQTVQACTITASYATQGTVTGNGVIVLSTKRGDGLVQENSFAETGYLTCTADSYTGNASAGNESFQFVGEVAQSNVFSNLWPQGSGGNTTFQAINGNKNNTQGNLLTNSDFETFTVANVPDNWVIVTGTPGTDIKQSTTAGTFYTGLSALQFVGGGLACNVTQTFNVSSAGTPGAVKPDGQYAVAVWLKVDVVPAAGVLTIDLVDGSNTVIVDDQAVSNSFTVSLPGLTTSFAASTGVFRLPKLLPATAKIRIRLTTPLSGGTNLYLDHLGLGAMTQLYAGGPAIAYFSGSTASLVKDVYSVTVTNNRGGASNLATMQTAADRVFGMRALNLLLPSSGSPTISDSLIS
jgi:hypothetical protein